MKTAGIICEYNPFHRGHAWQISTIRRLLGEDTAVVCAMSGEFVQRGDFAILRAQARAEAAVRGGADLVLELPLPWAISSAEAFAHGGVSVLEATGCADFLAFGSECGDTQALLHAARALLSEDFAPLLREKLSQGMSFASAREAAARVLLGEGASVLERPNDILGVEYCKALLQTASAIEPLALVRRGVSHDGGASGDGFASASHIRTLLAKGEDASSYLTEESAAIFAREHALGRAPVTMANAERAMLASLRRLGEEDFAAFDSGNEGLYRRFYAAVQTASTVDALLEAVKTKRYAYARLRRMLLSAYLGVTKDAAAGEVPYLRVLAFNARGREVLRRMKKTARVPILIKSADVRALDEKAQMLFALTARAKDQYVLAYPDLAAAGGGSAWTEGPVIV